MKLLNQKIIRGSKGYTLMELIVSISIMTTLAALAVPSFIETGNKAKGAKSLNNISNIGTAILASYNRVVGEGDQTATDGASAIATFNEGLVGGGDPTPINDTDPVIIYGDGNQTIIWLNLFPDGVPLTPFTNEPYKVVQVIEGFADWSMVGGTITLSITEIPSITIQDPAQPSIVATFTP